MQSALGRLPMIPLGTPVVFKDKPMHIHGRHFNPRRGLAEYQLDGYPSSAWYLVANDLLVLWGDPVC